MKKALFIISILLALQTHAQQNLLTQKISISLSQKKLTEVLQVISREGGFYFSYDSRIVNKDSLVSLRMNNASVHEILDKIFAGSLDYKENGNYIILRKRLLAQPPATLSIKTYIIKGKVKDMNTGLGVQDATIYEKTKLAVALTASDGSFILKLKTKSAMPLLNISKENYYDTSISVLLPENENIAISIQNKYPGRTDIGTITIISPTDTIPIIIPDSTIDLTRSASLVIDTTKIVERTELGKFLLSAKLKIQSVNLSTFYTTRIYQISLTPGLSTHGRLSPQVENLISLNVLGGYTGGTKAFEAAGLFNINRRNAQYFQAAGLLNIVGGNFTGLQAAGLHNHVLGNVNALQAAGISNYANYSMNGMQAAGIYNHVQDTAKGFQTAGIANYTGKKFTGVQVSGIGNIAAQTMNGVQVAAIFNYAKKLNGLQIGLINISDSSNGYAIGLVNVVKHGLHQIAISASEITNTNIDIKTGNKKLYSILHAGYNFSSSKKVFSYGYGVGTSLKFSNSISFQPELKVRYMYTGNWKFSNILSSMHLNVQAKLGKNISVFAAPAFNLYASNQTVAVSGYKFPLQPSGFPAVHFSNRINGWLGFSAGIALF